MGDQNKSLRAVKHLRSITDKSVKDVLSASEDGGDLNDNTLQRFKQEGLEVGRSSLHTVKMAFRKKRTMTLQEVADSGKKNAASSRAKAAAHRLGRTNEKGPVVSEKKQVFGRTEYSTEPESPEKSSFFSSSSKKAAGADRKRREAAGSKRARTVSAKKHGAAKQKKAASEKALVKRRAARNKALKGAGKAAKVGEGAARGARVATSTTGGRVVIIILAGLVLLVLGLMMMAQSSFVGAASSSAMAQSGLADINMMLIEDFKSCIGGEWAVKLRETREGLVASGIANADITVRYNASDSEDGDNEGVYRLDNWSDTFAVWLLLNDKVMEESDYDAIKDIYFKMNPITTSTAEVPVEETADDTVPAEDNTPAGGEAPSEAEAPAEEQPASPETGESAEIPPAVKTVGYIDVINYRYAEAADTFGLTAEQLAEAESWFTDDLNRSLWTELLGLGVSQGDDYSGMYVNIPAGSELETVFAEAVKMNGWQYSRSMRMKTGYADCSSFVWRCFHAAGIDIGSSSYPPTAAEQARWCDERNLRVRSGDEQAGDIIFWADPGRNNRYLSIYHVALYAGDGYMWESCPSANGVIYRKVSIQRPKNILFYARPSAA